MTSSARRSVAALVAAASLAGAGWAIANDSSTNATTTTPAVVETQTQQGFDAPLMVQDETTPGSQTAPDGRDCPEKGGRGGGGGAGGSGGGGGGAQGGDAQGSGGGSGTTTTPSAEPTNQGV